MWELYCGAIREFCIFSLVNDQEEGEMPGAFAKRCDRPKG